MSRAIRCGLLVVLTGLLPVGAEACCFLNPFNTCGGCRQTPWVEFGCALPFFGCGGGGGCGPVGCRSCPPPAGCGPTFSAPNPCGCGPTLTPSLPTLPTPTQFGPTLAPPNTTTWNYAPTPVCATAIQPQPVTTYRSVPTVQYRREAYIENVPVTTYQQITVPQTVYQPQTRYRDVAYTVNQTVAETHPQYLPRPQLSYFPPTPVAAAPCAPCQQSHAFRMTPQFSLPTHPSTIAAAPSAPYAGTSLGPVPTPITLPQSPEAYSTPAATLQPPQYAPGESWQTVPQRQAEQNTGVEQMGGFLPSYAPPAMPVSRSHPPRRSMFQPAPSAASVWQSRWMR